MIISQNYPVENLSLHYLFINNYWHIIYRAIRDRLYGYYNGYQPLHLQKYRQLQQRNITTKININLRNRFGNQREDNDAKDRTVR